MTDTPDKQWELDGPLFKAAEGGHVYEAQKLITAGANPNARDGGQMTPLHEAAVCNHLTVFLLLLENGADIEAKTVRGRTPRDLAERSNAADIVGWYVNRGADAPVTVSKPLKLRK